MVKQAAFWDKVARKYAAKPVDDVPAYERTLERTRAYLHGDDKVLELGCGTGTTALKLADAVGHLTATDIAPEMIAIANEKLSVNGPGNVSFAVGTLDDPAPEQFYDAVLGFNFLHLLEDVPGALKAIHARVKPGGIFISKTGCVAEASWFLRKLMIPAMQLIGKAPFVNGLLVGDVDSQIKHAGFEIVETETFSGMAPTRFVVARKI